LRSSAGAKPISAEAAVPALRNVRRVGVNDFISSSSLNPAFAG
jgi:hypothetical protein